MFSCCAAQPSSPKTPPPPPLRFSVDSRTPPTPIVHWTTDTVDNEVPPPSPPAPRLRFESVTVSPEAVAAPPVSPSPPPSPSPPRRAPPAFGDYSSSSPRPRRARRPRSRSEPGAPANREAPEADPDDGAPAQRTSLTTMDRSMDDSRSSAYERLRRHRRNREAKKAPAPEPAPPGGGDGDAGGGAPVPMTFAEATSPPAVVDSARDLASPDSPYVGHAVDLDDSDLNVFAVGPRANVEEARRTHDRWAATRRRYLDERGLESSGSIRDSALLEPACYNFAGDRSDRSSEVDATGCMVFVPHRGSASSAAAASAGGGRDDSCAVA